MNEDYIMYSIFLILITVGLYLARRPSTPSDFSHIIKQDQDQRHREQESIRQEMRETAKSLRDSLNHSHSFVTQKISQNQTEVQSQISESAKTLTKLHQELGKMEEVGQRIQSLDSLIRAPKSRGNMGEESLEEILRDIFPSNLWQRQFAIPGCGVVDAVVKTHQGVLPIDAKFPLPAFQRLIEAKAQDEQALHRKTFETDMKRRIEEVGKYVSPENQTLPFAILFVPNENLYYEVVVQNQNLPTYAKQKKVIIAGPQTLHYILQTLLQSYQSQQFATKAQEALQQIQGLQIQVESMEENLTMVSKHFQNANNKLNETQSQTQKLKTALKDSQNIEL